MDIFSPIPSIIAIGLAFLTSYLLGKRLPPAGEPGRISTIDGLRGYLAFFVFLSHAMIWYPYLRTGQWTVVPSNLYAHFGQSSVAFFFMITGFLFFSKLLGSRGKEMDWGKLYVSRVMRLTPLYLVAIAVLFLIVVIVSGGTRHESVAQLAREAATWLGFTVLGMPNINGFDGTFRIIAGVTWSLPYEWAFYFSLPLIGLLARVRVPLAYVALSVLAIVGFVLAYDKMNSLILFPMGMAAAVLVRDERFTKFAVGKPASLIAIGCVVAAVVFFKTAHGVVPVLLLAASFALIAGGNSLFGILTNATSRAFGETAYSVYLLHGLLLFVAFHMVIGHDVAATLTPVQHWLVVLAVTPVLVTISHFTFWMIEYPSMRSTTAVTGWLRRLLKRGAPRARTSS
nr:acyltransferase [uncultured Duganella sp.]